MIYGALVALLMISGCAGLPRETPPAPALSVFVVAHPGDWQPDFESLSLRQFL